VAPLMDQVDPMPRAPDDVASAPEPELEPAALEPIETSRADTVAAAVEGPSSVEVVNELLPVVEQGVVSEPPTPSREDLQAAWEKFLEKNRGPRLVGCAIGGCRDPPCYDD